MSRHTASICVDELAVCRAYSCVTCRESECMRAVCAYCDLICALSASPLMFVWSCLSTASLIMSLAVRLLQQLIAALLAVGCHSAARAPQSIFYRPLMSYGSFCTMIHKECFFFFLGNSHISNGVFYFTGIFFWGGW